MEVQNSPFLFVCFAFQIPSLICKVKEREREKAVNFHNLRVFFYDLIMESDGWELSGMTEGEKDKREEKTPQQTQSPAPFE